MDQVFLPGTIRDRIKDLMKSKKMKQAELAVRIGMAESTLSRFLRGDTDKLGNENIIRIARVFNVSTDFLLGEVDVPDRVNYDISELGLSVQAARNLYTHKVNPQVVNALLENPEFANTTNLISRYLDDELAKGQHRISFMQRSPECLAAYRRRLRKSRICRFRYISSI